LAYTLIHEAVKPDGESLHSYLADLQMAYDRAYAPPVVDELPESPSAAQKKKNNEQIAAPLFTSLGKLRMCYASLLMVPRRISGNY